MCECVWLMIVVVCVCRLGEEYVCGCVRVLGVRKDGLEGYVFCCDKINCIMDVLFLLFLNPVCLLIIIIRLNAFENGLSVCLSVYLSLGAC